MATVSIDPNIYITPSRSLIQHLDSHKDKLDNPPKRIRKILSRSDDELLADCKLTVEDVKWIVSCLPDSPASLLLSSDLELPTPQFAERNPDLEARCQKLRAEQENREYAAMTGNVRRDAVGPGAEEESFKKQFQEVNSFLLLIFQFIVSVACSFMFGFLGPYYLYGKTELGPRLLFGIICGAVVGCADMYFVIRQMLKEDGIDLAKKID